MNASPASRPLIAYYGDDFTGSTDVLEALTVGGVPTVLFLAPPDPALLRSSFPNTQAIGVAGVARSLPTPAMGAELIPALSALADLKPRFLFYKLCSTFDSSPETGSIGHALDLLRSVCPAPVLPLVVGAPALRRHVIFGNLFAGFGPEVVRLDRHPTMSRHPVTPMAEADLRVHLGRQTGARIELVDWLGLQASPEAVGAQLSEWQQEGTPRIVLFDTLGDDDLTPIGQIVAALGDAAEEAVSVPVAGSSVIAHALGREWRSRGSVASRSPAAGVGAADRVVVVSGSASPQTAAQIETAATAGWATFRIRVGELASLDRAEAETVRLERAANDALMNGRSVVLYSACGPDDPALMKGLRAAEGLGGFQGRLLRRILLTSGVRRACVSGGDTSGHAARQLGIYALEFLAPLAAGAPLCRAHSTDPEFPCLELALKGGQNGAPDYFIRLKQLRASHPSHLI